MRRNTVIQASTNSAVTTDLSDFMYRELNELRDILNAMLDNGLPEDFDSDGVVPALDRRSDDVFLTNKEYQVCMLNHNTGILELWYSTPYSGYEGFLDDLVEQYQDGPESWDDEDIEYLRDIGASI